MSKLLNFNTKECQVIGAVSKMLAEHQAAYLKVESECLAKLAKTIGFMYPEGGMENLRNRLSGLEHGGTVVIFDDEDTWRDALTRVAQEQLLDWAEEDIKSMRAALQASKDA